MNYNTLPGAEGVVSSLKGDPSRYLHRWLQQDMKKKERLSLTVEEVKSGPQRDMSCPDDGHYNLGGATIATINPTFITISTT